MTSLTLGRNPFARHTLRKAEHRHGSCDNCGHEGRTFQILVDDDQGPRQSGLIRGRFCSMSCARSYHD